MDGSALPGSCCCSLTCAQLLARLSLSAWPPPQIVLNRGSSGCAQLPPGPPINLRATPGDGEVTLTWDRPRNGACVTTYEVMAVPLGRSGRSLGMAPIRRCADRLLLQQARRADGAPAGAGGLIARCHASWPAFVHAKGRRSRCSAPAARPPFLKLQPRLQAVHLLTGERPALPLHRAGEQHSCACSVQAGGCAATGRGPCLA